MTIKRKTPEEEYEEILISGDVYAAISFIRREIQIVDEVYNFIKTCNNDSEFDQKINNILYMISKIRLKKLQVIEKNIRFYQFKRKKYYTKLFNLIYSK